MSYTTCMIALAVLSGFTQPGAETQQDFISVAVLDFQSKVNKGELGGQVGSLLTAFMSTEEQLILVEREDLAKVLSEQGLGLTGTIRPADAATIGQLTGAKVIVTGRVFDVDQERIFVAKIIGTETSRVYGETVKGHAGVSVSDACRTLARKIAANIKKNGQSLLAQKQSADDVIGRLNAKLKGKQRPSVSVQISEAHNRGFTMDPAAETEISYMLKKLGFEVIDHTAAIKKPDIKIVGEAFSEFGLKIQDMYSCRARLEVKAIRVENGDVVAIDRQTSVAVDLGELIAGKSALQKAAKELTERLAEELVK